MKTESIQYVMLPELPKDFPLADFTQNLLVTFNTIADVMTPDDWGIMQIIFLNHVSKAFVTSSYFNALPEDEKLEAIGNLNSLRYMLELMGDLYTDGVHKHSWRLAQYLKEKLTS